MRVCTWSSVISPYWLPLRYPSNHLVLSWWAIQVAVVLFLIPIGSLSPLPSHSWAHSKHSCCMGAMPCHRKIIWFSKAWSHPALFLGAGIILKLPYCTTPGEILSKVLSPQIHHAALSTLDSIQEVKHRPSLLPDPTNQPGGGIKEQGPPSLGTHIYSFFLPIWVLFLPI